jgi:hypothetical protein
MKKVFLLACIFIASFVQAQTNLIGLSQTLLLNVKSGDSVTTQLDSLANHVTLADLQTQLKTDGDKKAFWINIYNAFTQILLTNNPEQYKSRGQFFRSKQIVIAGQKWSLDFVEHGILRHSKNKLAMGYLNKFFPSSTEKQLRVEKLDYRIHFALNCGAKSCPPIAYYDAANIDKQLDIATKTFIKNEIEWDKINNEAYVPKIFSWFIGDFKGKAGIIDILHKYGKVPEDYVPAIKFKDYNWTLELKKFQSI